MIPRIRRFYEWKGTIPLLDRWLHEYDHCIKACNERCDAPLERVRKERDMAFGCRPASFHRNSSALTKHLTNLYTPTTFERLHRTPDIHHVSSRLAYSVLPLLLTIYITCEHLAAFCTSPRSSPSTTQHPSPYHPATPPPTSSLPSQSPPTPPPT
jgi:hypothetical protein